MALALRPGNEREVLSLAASLEQSSEHALAGAVIAAAREHNAPLDEVDAFESVTGKGVGGVVRGKRVLVGSPRYLEGDGVALSSLKDAIDAHEGNARTVVAVARDGMLIGILAIADAIKPDAAEAIRRLRSQGVRTVMVTGDNQATADAVARQTGLDAVLAQVLPQGKAEHVRALQREGKKVAFVGDGINDAPALAQADLGIAIGSGTEIAIEAGDIVLVKGHPSKAVEALALAQRTFKTIKQNLFWAFAYNAAAIPLAALGLLDPMIAAGAMALSSVTVVGNSLAIRRSVKEPTS